MPFEHNYFGFFTILTVSLEKYFQDFCREDLAYVFDALFPHVDGDAADPGRKERHEFYEWGLDNNYPPIGFYSAYPGLSVQDIQALLADRKSELATAG